MKSVVESIIDSKGMGVSGRKIKTRVPLDYVFSTHDQRDLIASDLTLVLIATSWKIRSCFCSLSFQLLKEKLPPSHLIFSCPIFTNILE
jgi:hypothetical protein